MRRVVKALVVFFSVALLLAASYPAAAQRDPQGGRRFGPGVAGRPLQPKREPARDPAAENDVRRATHMTPEQRQQLRKDIHDHGRDIYRRRDDAGRRR